MRPNQSDPQKIWPVIIVGSGPAGMRTAESLLKGNSGLPILIYGNEAVHPYQRARLSEFLAGDAGEASLKLGEHSLKQASLVERRGCAVTRLNPELKTVTDASGRTEYYKALVLATGSVVRRYYIPGMSLPGVFTFRNLQDAKELMKRRKAGRRIVILGGGALGLETALAMRRGGAEVTVIDHNVRLMGPQLDKRASGLLQKEMMALGIHFHLSEGIKTIFWVKRVSGIQFWQGGTMNCDTVILATGVQANTGLAKPAGLKIGQGILVNDRMETSAEHIYAVGECAQHRGRVYRLVAPGLAQADVAASVILNRDIRYKGSVTATRLKNIETNVFSMGAVENAESRLWMGNPMYEDTEKKLYRKLVLKNGHLSGLIVIGEWDELSRLQNALIKNRYLTILERIRFMLTGNVFKDPQGSRVANWPADTLVCQCLGISRGTLSDKIKNGCTSLESLAKETGASRVCGSCKPLLADLTGGGIVNPAPCIRKPLMGISIVAAVFSFTIFMVPPIPFSETVQGGWRLETLWLDGFWKQVTGYHLLGLLLLSLLLSAKKRIKFFKLGSFNGWRTVHTIMGLLMLAVLVLHTGFSLGSNLNFVLMTSFLCASLLGTLAGAAAALERKLGMEVGATARRWGNTLHIFASWPLPVLLIFHIVSVYFF